MHTPSKYQAAVYNFIESGTGNAVIDAVAGSGKSTTLVEALKRIPPHQTVLFLAFNKAIVEELKIKVGNMANVQIYTLHSMGSSAVNRSLWDVEINADKYKKFIHSMDAQGFLTPDRDLEPAERKEFKSNIFQLIDLCRLNLCNDKDRAKELASKHDLHLLSNEVKYAFRAIKWGLQNEDEIDFTDMIFFPIIKKMRVQQYDWVFIDECQDLNTCQRELFLKCLKPEGRFIAVGDPHQSIYGFAGADIESFRILQRLPNTVTLPLSVCYRCDSSIIRLAKTIVPHIEAREGAYDGIVDREAKLLSVSDGDMILCRTVSPLVDVCIDYIKQGIKAYIKGGDIGANLVRMIQNTNRESMEDVMLFFEKELSKIALKYSKTTGCSLQEARESSAYESYEDKVTAISILSEGINKSSAVVSRIITIFSDKNQGICLSTIHKSKGLECDRVFILCPEKMMLAKSMQIEWMAEQERNLVYVAYTRAKHYLGFITDKGFNPEYLNSYKEEDIESYSGNGYLKYLREGKL